MDSSQLSLITVVKDDFVGFVRTAMSVFRQSNSDFRWVIVDGSSNEDIESFLKDAPSAIQITYIKRIPNGIYDAMNYGLVRSGEGWSWFINAGDFFISASATRDILNIVSSLETEEEIGGIATSVAYVTHQGFLWDVVVPRIERHGEIAFAHLNHQGFILNNRSALELGGFDKTYKLAGDSELLDKVVSKKKVLLQNQIYVAFIIGGASSYNYRASLLELNQVRYLKNSNIRILNSVARNRMRNWLIESSSNKLLARCKLKYAYHREKWVRRKYTEYLSEVLIDHS